MACQVFIGTCCNSVQICACTALFFSVVHSCGHLVNFYHVSTQPLEHIACLSPELSFHSDQRPDAQYWLFQVGEENKRQSSPFK